MFLRSFLRIFVVLNICWVLLVWPFSGSAGVSERWFIGFVVCFFVAYLEIRTLPQFPLVFPWSPLRWYWLFRFALRFLRLMLVANLDVAYRVLHPSLPIKPGIVKVKTCLKNPMARLILANAITLTPGTLVVDMDSDGSLYVHWICVLDEKPEIAEKYIIKPFEDLLYKAFE